MRTDNYNVSYTCVCVFGMTLGEFVENTGHSDNTKLCTVDGIKHNLSTCFWVLVSFAMVAFVESVLSSVVPLTNYT